LHGFARCEPRRKGSATVRHFLSPLLAAALLVLPARHAAADNLLGLYVGGAIGQAQVSASVNGASFAPFASDAIGEFKANHLAFKIIAGIRPIALIGAEVEYIDLGHPAGSLFDYPANAATKGAAAFGVLYLPVPVVDIYLKAGAARLQNSLSGVVPYLPLCAICAPPRFDQDRTNAGFAAGAGLQYKFGAWAVRAEYERYNAAGEHPNLMSLGLTWSL
jgi:opacity protein-like surface antigen